MKRGAQILLLFAGAFAALTVLADEKDQAKDKKRQPKPVPLSVYFGSSHIDSAAVKKPLFDSLITQELTCTDSNGRVFNVTQFRFTFCERVLYEDSVGNPLLLTDYHAEFAIDNKLDDFQRDVLLRRAKPGDTLIIEKITLEAADSTKAGAHGKPIKLIITR